MIILLASCQTPNDPFNRPKISPCISNGDGTCFKNGELIEDTTNWLMINTDEYDQLYEYYDDIELRLYICKKYRKKCK